MSEGGNDEMEEPSDDRTPLSSKEVVRFLESVTGESYCQACGSDSFSLGNDNQNPDNPAIVKLEVGRKRSRRIILPAVTVVCSKCGWLRMHAEAVVSRWLEANPEGEA